MADNVEPLTTPLVEQAIKIAELGLKVIPAVGKRCPLPGWQNRCSEEESEIRQMFSEVPDATNVAVVCGQSGLFVIDLDRNKKGETGPDGLDWQKANSHNLPATRVHETPSGGYHLIYRMPDGMQLPNISVANKVDSRGMSGYIIWPTENSGYKVYRDRKVKVLGNTFALSLQQRASEISTISMQEIIAHIITDASGFALHDLVNQYIYRLAKDGRDVASIISLTREVMDKSEAKSTRPSDWADRYDDIPRSASGAVKRVQKVAAKPDEADEALGAALRGIGIEGYSGIRTEEIGAPEPSSEDFSGIFQRFDRETAVEPLPKPKWVIPGMFERGAVTGIAGAPNTGKTLWMSSAAISIMTGEPLLGFEVEETGNVMLISHEESTVDLRQKLTSSDDWHELESWEHDIIIAGSEVSGPLVLAKDAKNEVTINQAVVDYIVESAIENEVIVVFLDPLVSFSIGMNENDASMHVLMKALRQIAGRADVAVCPLHHTPKGPMGSGPDWYMGSLNGFRGSGAIGGALDIAYTLSRIGKEDSRAVIAAGEDAPQWVRLEQAKSRLTKGDQRGVYFIEGNIIYSDEGEPYDVGVMTLRSEEALAELVEQGAIDALAEVRLEKALDALRAEDRLNIRDVWKEFSGRDVNMNADERKQFHAMFPVETDEGVYDLVVPPGGKQKKLLFNPAP